MLQEDAEPAHDERMFVTIFTKGLYSAKTPHFQEAGSIKRSLENMLAKQN